MKTSPLLRRIVAIYFDDALSQAGPEQLESFVTQFLRSSKMKAAGTRVASRLNSMASAAITVWPHTTSNPPSLRRAWMRTMLATIQHYKPIFIRMGLHGEMNDLQVTTTELVRTMKTDPQVETSGDDHFRTVLGLLAGEMNPGPLFRDIERFEQMYVEMYKDAEEVGWGSAFQEAQRSLRGPLAGLYTSWMRPRGALEFFHKHLPNKEWVIDWFPSDFTLEDFLAQFAEREISEMESWLLAAKALWKVADALLEVVPWTIRSEDDALSELIHDLSYLCTTQLALLGHFPKTSFPQKQVGPFIQNADFMLSNAFRTPGKKPLSAQQANTANQAYAKLAGALKALDNSSLYWNSMLDRMVKDAPEALSGRELARLKQILQSEVDQVESVRIAESIEDRTPAVLAQNPLR